MIYPVRFPVYRLLASALPPLLLLVEKRIGGTKWRTCWLNERIPLRKVAAGDGRQYVLSYIERTEGKRQKRLEALRGVRGSDCNPYWPRWRTDDRKINANGGRLFRECDGPLPSEGFPHSVLMKGYAAIKVQLAAQHLQRTSKTAAIFLKPRTKLRCSATHHNI